MKISKLVLVMAVATIGIVSCKKDEGRKSATGDWEGNWGFGYETPSYYERWELKKNGTLTSFYTNGDVYATGVWEEDGEDFEARYSPIGVTYTYTFSGTYDDRLDEITGIWTESQDPTNGGTFAMYRD